MYMLFTNTCQMHWFLQSCPRNVNKMQSDSYYSDVGALFEKYWKKVNLNLTLIPDIIIA